MLILRGGKQATPLVHYGREKKCEKARHNKILKLAVLVVLAECP